MIKTLPDPNYPEIPMYGMNNYDSDKSMVNESYRGYFRQLTNTYPGPSQKQRKGMNDLAYSLTALGYNNTQTVFKSKGVHWTVESKEYVFVWSQSITTNDEYQIELWNLTDGSREILESIKLENADAHFSMVKLYNSIYCTCDYQVSINHTSQYRTLNWIIEYDDGFFVRCMGLDDSPAVQNRYVVESAAESGFIARHLAGAVEHNGRMWIIGGEDGTTTFETVYSSIDGKLWTNQSISAYEPLLDESGNYLLDESGNIISNPATFKRRTDFVALVFSNKIWIMGGKDESGTNLNDVWYSEDGAIWYYHRRSSDWSARYGFTGVVHAGAVYIAGGYDVAALNDVWTTTDFITWTQVTVSTAFTARYGHSMLSYNGYMWIFLGNGVTNTYQSNDGGANWTEVNADIGIGELEYHRSIVFENKMWIIGGNVAGTRQNSVYSSTDGDTWTTVDASADWTIRSGLCLLPFLNKIFVFAGYTGALYLNDVWSSINGYEWVNESAGLTAQRYYSYASTFVRRTDTRVILSDYTDYDYEAWEEYNGQTIVGIDEVLLVGTVSLSGNALTGVGTTFTDLTVGQSLRIASYPTNYEITAITNDTSLTVDNSIGDAHTAQEFALLPSIGDYVSSEVFEDGDAESIEDSDKRVVVYNFSTEDTARIFINIPFRSYEAARAKGATHLRLYRTLGALDYETAQGLDHRFLIDVAIELVADLPEGQYEYKVLRDGMTDDQLQYETNFLSVTGLEVAPLGRYCIWAAGTLWIGGNPETKGFWYRSEFATGKNPKKWSTFFDTTANYFVCDPEDGQEDTGCSLLGGDLYLFKERKIFRLINSDLENDVVRVSNSIGCICPDSIVTAEVPALGGACILFLSEIGPAVLTPGGEVRILTEFKIAQLYYDKTGIIKDSTGVKTSWCSRNKVQAEFFNNSYIVSFGDSEDDNCGIKTNEVYAMYFDIDKEYYGAYQYVFGVHDTEGVVYEPTVFIRMNDTLLGLSHKSFGETQTYRVTRFEDQTVQQDTFMGGVGTLSYKMVVDSRYIPVGNYRFNEAKARLWRAFIDYSDTEELTVRVRAQYGKFISVYEVTLVRQEGIFKTESLAYRDYIAGAVKPGVTGKSMNMYLEKVVPSTGDVEFTGFNLDIEEIEREHGDEWICEGVNAITDKTFTVDANAVTEVDAYA